MRLFHRLNFYARLIWHTVMMASSANCHSKPQGGFLPVVARPVECSKAVEIAAQASCGYALESAQPLLESVMVGVRFAHARDCQRRFPRTEDGGGR